MTGINPVGSLIAIPDSTGQSANLFGVTQNGGSSDQNTGFGTIFKINTLTYANGIPPTIIHSFGDGSVTNDGQTPLAGLCLGADGNLYGTTVGGGAGYGTAFAIAANLLGLPQGAVPSSYYTLTGTCRPD